MSLPPAVVNHLVSMGPCEAIITKHNFADKKLNLHRFKILPKSTQIVNGDLELEFIST